MFPVPTEAVFELSAGFSAHFQSLWNPAKVSELVPAHTAPSLSWYYFLLLVSMLEEQDSSRAVSANGRTDLYVCMGPHWDKEFLGWGRIDPALHILLIFFFQADVSDLHALYGNAAIRVSE